MKNYLTHKEIENLCDATLCEQGWVRQVETGNPTDPALWGGFLPSVPDRIYKKADGLLVLEIKPGNSGTQELKKGLGQVMCYFPYQLKVYFVISDEHWEKLRSIVSSFTWLGVMVYEQKKKRRGVCPLYIAQKAVPSPAGGFLPFPIPMVPWSEWVEIRKYQREWERMQARGLREDNY